MAKSDALFSLIKSMTKAEKRYFKLESSKGNSGETKDYLRLFDAIEGQGVNDDSLLKKQFKGEPYFNQLAAVKIYLHRQIIKSLNNFYQDSSNNILLNNYLTEIEVLYKKNLLKNCQSTIQKAKKLCYKFEAWIELVRLLSWERKVIVRIMEIEKAHEVIQGLREEKRMALAKHEEVEQLVVLTDQVHLFFSRKGYAKTLREKKNIELIISNKSLQEPANSFQAEAGRFSILANCYLILGNHEQRFQASKMGIEFFQRFPDQIDEYLQSYFYNLRELADQALNLKKFSYAETLVNLMNDLFEKKQKRLSIKSHVLYLDLQASLLVHKGDFESALKLIPALHDLRLNHAKSLEPVDIMFIHNICFHIYFRNRNFRKTQYHLQQIISSGPQIRWDLQCLARIANLIVQYEQKEYEHLAYVLRSTYRFLLKKEMLEKPEQLIIKFIKKTLTLKTEPQILRALSEFRNEFFPYKEEAFIVSFPLIEWIDSKLQNRELAEIVKENYLKVIKQEKVVEKRSAVLKNSI